MWEASGGSLKLRAIAEKLGIPEKTVSAWKSKDNWGGVVNRSTPKKERSTPNDSAVYDPAKRWNVTAVEENEELTDKQRLFCVYYMESFNASQAARDAGYSKANASSIGYQLLQKTTVAAEIAELKRIKNASLGGLCGDDIIELHMRIAFANMNKFTEFKGKTVPVVYRGKVVMVENPKTGESLPATETINVVKLKDSSEVDGQLISKVAEGKDGVRIELRDSQKSLEFLARYFELFPMDRHRKEYDRKRHELEKQKAEALQQTQGGDIEDLTPLAEMINCDEDTDDSVEAVQPEA